MQTELSKNAKAMTPSNANDAWWAGFRDCCEGKTECPHLISGPAGEDIPEYWYWDAGWWFASYNNALQEMKGPFQ